MTRTPEQIAATKKRKELQAKEGVVAMREYRAAQLAERQKTARLRALRLSQQQRNTARPSA
jgi:hypothetical protein